MTRDKIIICSTCNGKGTTLQRTSAYDSEDVECSTCKGSGRLIETYIIKPLYIKL